MKQVYDFAHLEKNISDMIYEGMVKIGYMEQKKVSVYYDAGLLAWLLNAADMSREDWKECLRAFKEYAAPRFGQLVIKRQKDRFEVQVPEEGVAYIYNNNESREFLGRLVEVLNGSEVTLEQVTKVFLDVSPDVIIEQMDHGEFQYVIHFQDKGIDEFRYCFTFDEMGHYYHRLLEYDFEQVIACEC